LDQPLTTVFYSTSPPTRQIPHLDQAAIHSVTFVLQPLNRRRWRLRRMMWSAWSSALALAFIYVADWLKNSLASPVTKNHTSNHHSTSCLISLSY